MPEILTVIEGASSYSKQVSLMRECRDLLMVPSLDGGVFNKFCENMIALRGGYRRGADLWYSRMIPNYGLNIGYFLWRQRSDKFDFSWIDIFPLQAVDKDENVSRDHLFETVTYGKEIDQTGGHRVPFYTRQTLNNQTKEPERTPLTQDFIAGLGREVLNSFDQTRVRSTEELSILRTMRGRWAGGCFVGPFNL